MRASARCNQQGLISSPNLSNEELVTEAEAALKQMKLQVLEGQLALNTGNAQAWTSFDAARKAAGRRPPPSWTRAGSPTTRAPQSSPNRRRMPRPSWPTPASS